MLSFSIPLLAPLCTWGHELTEGVGTQTVFELHKDHLELSVNFGVSQPAGFETLFNMDTDFSGKVSRDEEAVFLEKTAKHLVDTLQVYVNGHHMRLTEISRKGIGIVGEVSAVPLDTWFEFTCPLPAPLPDGGWWLHFNDQSYRDVLSAQRLKIPWHDQGEGISYVVFQPEPEWWVDEPGWSLSDKRELHLFFDQQPHPSIVPGQVTPPTVEDLQKQLGVDPTKLYPEESATPAKPPQQAEPNTDDDTNGETTESEPQANAEGDQGPTTEPDPNSGTTTPWLWGGVPVVLLLTVLLWRRKSRKSE